MDLRDVASLLAAADDERRALSRAIERSLDALDAAIAGSDRLAMPAGQLAGLRDGIASGADESVPLDEASAAISSALLDAARDEAQRAARAMLAAEIESAGDTRSGDEGAEDLEALATSLRPVVEGARDAWEAIGRIRHLLARRSDVDGRIRLLREPLEGEPEAAELLDVARAARSLAASEEDRDPVAILDSAEAAAASDGQLAGIAANARALRDAIVSAKDTAAIAGDLSARVVAAALRSTRARDEERRRIAGFVRDVDRHQSVAQGLAQAASKAAAVVRRVATFERRPQADQVKSGALGPLKAACLEHGIISMMLGLRDLRIDRVDFDRALSDLSGALGALVTHVDDRPEVVERIVPAWEDLAAVDARTMEPDWQAALWEVIGLQVDRHGALAVAPDKLSRLAVADSLEPWCRGLLQSLDARNDEVLKTTRRLEDLDEVLTDLVESEGPLAESAIAVKAALTLFVGEALHLVGNCHDRVRESLLHAETGFAIVEDRAASFRHVEDLPDEATAAERLEAVRTTLEEVRERFKQLRELGAGQSGPDGAGQRDTERRLRDAAVAAHRRLAATLARTRRLQQLVLPPLPVSASDAIALARALRADPSRETRRERLGEALEALHVEREMLSLVTLPSAADPVLRSLAGRRARQLMDVRGATLTLLFRLLQAVGSEHERLSEGDRPTHLEWIDELVSHATAEMTAYGAVLDEHLLELPGNAERLDRHALAFDAYHSWAVSVEETEVGMELAARHGKGLFARMEEPLGRLGTSIIDSIRPDASDWRAAGALESVMELQAALLARLATRPTLSDLPTTIGALRERAVHLRDEVVSRAEASDPFARGGGGRFGT